MVTDEGHNICVQALLGKVYEEQGRLVRAYSRYRQASQLLAPFLSNARFHFGAGPAVAGKRMAEDPGRSCEKNFRMMQAIRPQIEAGLARLEPKISAHAKEMLDAK